MTKHIPLVLAALVLALAGCAEKEQTAHTRKSDARPWDGTTNAPYAASGWKQGDQASWEEQMRARAQSQNEYARSATK